ATSTPIWFLAGLQASSTIYGTTLTIASTTLLANTEGKVGIASSSPFALLSLMAQNGATNTTLFAIGSSTSAFATSTLFSITNTGLITGGNFSLANGTTTGSLAVTGSTTISGALNAVNGGYISVS